MVVIYLKKIPQDFVCRILQTNHHIISMKQIWKIITLFLYSVKLAHVSTHSGLMGCLKISDVRFDKNNLPRKDLLFTEL